MEFVLVHGTTQSPRGWDQLVDVLAARDHRVTTIDLAFDVAVKDGHADVDRYLDTVAAQAAGTTAPVVVAHSGAGAVLPGLAQRLHASRQVWIAAWVPDPISARSLLDEIGEDGASMLTDEWRNRDSAELTEVEAAYFLFHDCDFPTLRQALATVRIWSPLDIYQARPQVDPTAVPSTYILPTSDRTMNPDWMDTAARQRLGVEPTRVDAGHCPHVSQPAALAALLETAPATSRDRSSWRKQ